MVAVDTGDPQRYSLAEVSTFLHMLYSSPLRSPLDGSVLQITFDVIDENDNAPNFSDSEWAYDNHRTHQLWLCSCFIFCSIVFVYLDHFEASFNEDIAQGGLVAQLRATDADSGVFGTVYYSIIEGNDVS